MKLRLLIAIGLLLSACAAAPPPLGPTPENGSGTISIPTITLPEDRFPTSSGNGAPAVVQAEFNIPPNRGARAPAVVVMHGCSGLLPGSRRWAAELGRAGYATLVFDSFGGRALKETCTGNQNINLGSRIIDAYRGLEFLAAHPQIDPRRIALMGFSQGGAVTLLARYRRFQRLWLADGRGFAAYLAFYPGACNRKLLDEAAVDDAPLRIFHGAADDWTPIGPCREYVARMKAAGKDAALLEYADAHHGFDGPGSSLRSRPEVLNSGKCLYVELAGGRFAAYHADSGARVTAGTPCLTRGATVGNNPRAYRRALEDVKNFLSARLGAGEPPQG